MKQLIDSIKKSLDNKNWYAALFISLCMPDICGRIEYTNLPTSERYIQWYNAYLLEKYSLDQSWQIPQLESALYNFNKSSNAKVDKTIGNNMRRKVEGLKRDPKDVFLSGKDCYALRCSYLHEGSGDITNQKINDVLNRIIFTLPECMITGYMNKSGTQLQLQVDCFCNDMLNGVNLWLNDIKEDVIKMHKINCLPKILPFGSSTFQS